MRSSKRVLAGVAAGALGFALVPMVGVTSANAASLSGTTTPVRVTYTASTLDAVPYAALSWTGAAADDTAVLALTSAPSGIAKVAAAAAQGTVSMTGAATLGGAASAVTLGAGSGDDSVIYIASDTAGSYVGTVTTYNAGAAANTVSFSFTTTGAASSLSMDVNASQVPKSTANAGMFTLNVKDSGGNLTQLLSVDGVTMSTTETGAAWDDTSVTAAQLYAGTYDVALNTAATGGTFTATATPTGTPWGSAQTGSYSVIDNVAATSIFAVDSSTQVNQTTATGSGGAGIAKPGTTSLNFGLTVSTANAGKPVVVTIGGNAWTSAGVDAPSPVVVSTDSSGAGTFTVTVPAAGAFASNATVTVAASSGTGTYTSRYTAGTYYCDSDYTSRSPSAGTIALPTGSTQDVAFSVDDSYGAPLAGLIVAATASGQTTQQGVTDANGEVTLTLPAPALSTTTSVTWAFTVGGASGSTGACKALTLAYSDSAEVTLTDPEINGSTTTDYTGTGSATSPAVIPYGGYIRGYTGATAADGKQLAVSGTVGVNNVNVDFSAPAGVWFCATDDTYQLGTDAFAAGCMESSMTYTASTATVTAFVQATKPGTYTITGTTTSGNTATWDVTFKNEADAARNVELSAQPSKVGVGSSSSITVAITDVFGNAVALDGGAEKVTVTTDLGTLAGGTNIYSVTTTDSAGRAILTSTSAVEGIATIAATGSGGQFGDDADVPFTGAAASVYQAAVPVEYTSAPTTQTIVIVGERGTVRGKPGIMVDGNTTGFAEGDLMVPWIKFPGQTEYSAGSARPAVDADGEFYWSRKTGKKIYVYFKNEAGDVKSDRIIIQAK